MGREYAPTHVHVKTNAEQMRAHSCGARYAMRMITADDIRKILKTTGWTQAQLAKRVGVNQSTVSRWLAGDQIPDPRQQEILHQMLGPAEPKPNSQLADQIYAAIEGVLLGAGLPEDEVRDMLRLSREACAEPLEPHSELSALEARRVIARFLARKSLKPK